MTEVVATLAFELYLIACCLFAPVDRKGFEIEMREGQRTQGPVMYVERTDAGFMIFGNKEHKGDALSVRKSGDRYALVQDRGGKKTEYAIDNAKAKISPLDKAGKYVKEIDGQQVTFELTDGTRKVYQKHNDKLFIVK